MKYKKDDKHTHTEITVKLESQSQTKSTHEHHVRKKETFSMAVECKLLQNICTQSKHSSHL